MRSAEARSSRQSKEANHLCRTRADCAKSDKSRSSCTDKQKMVETFWNQVPAPNQRIAQNERGVIPDKPIAERRGIANEDSEDDQQEGERFFHLKKEVRQNQ